MMLKLKLQYFGHLMRRVDSLEKTLMLAGGEGDDRRWDGWMASLTRWTWVWVNPGSWWWTGRPGVLWFMGSQRVGRNWATELNWTDWTWSKSTHIYFCYFLSILIILILHILIISGQVNMEPECSLEEFSTVYCDPHSHRLWHSRSDQIRSVAQLCPTLCDPMNRSMPGLPVHHQHPEFTQT